MGFQNKGELEKAATWIPATAFPSVRSGCSPAEPDCLEYKNVTWRAQVGTCPLADSSSV